MDWLGAAWLVVRAKPVCVAWHITCVFHALLVSSTYLTVQAAVFQVTSILGAGLVLFMSRGGADDYDDGYTAF